MKKWISAALAVVMTAAMAVTAFAAEITLSLGADKNGTALSGSVLTPGEEYRFPILAAEEGGEAEQITAAQLEENKLTVTLSKGGTAVLTPTIEKGSNGGYELVVQTKAAYGVKDTDVSLKIRYLVKSSSKELASLTVDFSVGFKSMDDSTLDALGKGEDLIVDPDTPIITKAQFEKLAALNDYKAVVLAHGSWRFSVNVTGMETANLYSSEGAIREIAEKYEDQEFKFLSFPGAPDFGTKGTLTIDVSEEEEDFGGEFYLYRYLDGTLYFLKSQYDAEASELSFTPSQLGTYVITNKEIKSGTVVSGSGGTSSGSASGSLSNPDTGAHDLIGLAAALAAVSVAAAAVTARRRRK